MSSSSKPSKVLEELLKTIQQEKTERKENKKKMENSCSDKDFELQARQAALKNTANNLYGFTSSLPSPLIETKQPTKTLHLKTGETLPSSPPGKSWSLVYGDTDSVMYVLK